MPENPFDHPAVQAGLAPLVVALIAAILLGRTRFAWVAIALGYLTAMALTSGIAFSPLTAGRKILLLGIVTPIAGIATDLVPAPRRPFALPLAAALGALAIWVFWSVLSQRDGPALYAMAAGVAAFVATAVFLASRLRNDGLRAGAAGVGLGLATGVAALLSASLGFLFAGIAIAAAAGALLLAQVLLSPRLVAGARTPGFTGTLTIGLMSALFAAGTLLLAELPWYALPPLLAVPLAVTLPTAERLPRIARAAVLVGYALVAAVFPILAAWLATRGPSS